MAFQLNPIGSVVSTVVLVSVWVNNELRFVIVPVIATTVVKNYGNGMAPNFQTCASVKMFSILV